MNEDTPPTLASVIDKAMDKNQATGYRELARRSEELGVAISHTTLSAMHKGTYRSEVSKDMRQRLATLSGQSLASLDGITGFAGQQPFTLPDSAATLTAEQREAVLGVVRAFVNDNRKEAAGGNAAATTTAPADELNQRRQGRAKQARSGEGKAARHGKNVGRQIRKQQDDDAEGPQ